MTLYANLDTENIASIEQDTIALRDRLVILQRGLDRYLQEQEEFQHTTSTDKHRAPSLYEFVSTLGINANRLRRTLLTLEQTIVRGKYRRELPNTSPGNEVWADDYDENDRR